MPGRQLWVEKLERRDVVLVHDGTTRHLSYYIEKCSRAEMDMEKADRDLRFRSKPQSRAPYLIDNGIFFLQAMTISTVRQAWIIIR